MPSAFQNPGFCTFQSKFPPEQSNSDAPKANSHIMLQVMKAISSIFIKHELFPQRVSFCTSCLSFHACTSPNRIKHQMHFFLFSVRSEKFLVTWKRLHHSWLGCCFHTAIYSALKTLTCQRIYSRTSVFFTLSHPIFSDRHSSSKISKGQHVAFRLCVLGRVVIKGRAPWENIIMQFHY